MARAGDKGRGWRSRLAMTLLVTVAGLGAGCGRGDGRLETKPTPVPAGSASPAVGASSPGGQRDKPNPFAPHVAEVDLSHGVPETELRGLFSVPKGRSFADLMSLLHRISAGKEKRVRALFVRFGGVRIGFGQAKELGDALANLRKDRVRVVCHAHAYTNTTYWIAARGCDEVWVSPAGEVSTVGIAGQVLYGKRLFDKLHVEVQMLQIGKYKGAKEPFTRDGPSPEAQQSLESTLRTLRKTWLEQVAKARGSAAAGAVEEGPYTPAQALKLGLVDHVGYGAEAAAGLEGRVGVDQTVKRFGPGAKGLETPELVRIVRYLAGTSPQEGRDRVAVLRAVGSIGMGGDGGAFGEGGISARRIIEQLRKLQRVKSIKAVVLRIDSPGGSALASDLMWKQIMTLRQSKPVIVSVGNMAASGGYYMACAGTKIFADETSIVGSIGVVGGKFAIGRSLEEVGITSRVFPASSAPGAGRRAAYLSPLVAWDEQTKQRVWESMKSVYDLFVSRVAAGRGLPVAQVEKFAEGRLFAASEGKKLGMVDQLGGLEDAIAFAKRSAGLDQDAPVEIVTEKSGLLEALDLDEDEARARMAMQRPRQLVRLAKETFGRQLVDYTLSLTPMLQGEHALVSVPFALIVR